MIALVYCPFANHKHPGGPAPTVLVYPLFCSQISQFSSNVNRYQKKDRRSADVGRKRKNKGHRPQKWFRFLWPQGVWLRI